MKRPIPRNKHRVPRISIELAAIAMIATACAGGLSAEDDRPDASPAPSSTLLNAPQGVLPDGPSALERPDAPEFPEPLVDLSDIISGGPPPDGIPPIENPVFLDVLSNLGALEDDEPVVALAIGGEAKAYPVSAMIWHEIVNDTLAGVPVAITYCPLCNSAVTYVRKVRGVETTFGTSGRLFGSALVMYDRATESLWTHFDGRAVVGLLTGEQLDVYASPLMSWSDFRSAYPTGRLLDITKTGFSRPYGQNPYTGYDNPDSDPFLFRGSLDDRARAKERVVGVSYGGVDVAYNLLSVSGDGPTATSIDHGGAPLVILWVPGQSSALEGDLVRAGRDVGSVGVFVPVVNGRTLTITANGGGFMDLETESRWNVAGQAISGPLAASQLERVPHLDTFWFAWSTYRPSTVLVGRLG